jgi:hypothetical protein
MIDHQQLNRVGVVKYLGMQIDEKLHFAENFNFFLMKMATKESGFFGRIRRKLTLNIRILIIIVHLFYTWHQKNN